MSSPDNAITCELVRQRLAEAEAASLLQNLTPDVNAHLGECQECAAYHKEILGVCEGLGGLTIVAPSELYPQVMQALPARPLILTRKLVVLLGVLAIALSVLVAQYAYLHQRNRQVFDFDEHIIPAPTCNGTLTGIKSSNTEAYSPTSQPEPEQSTPSQSARSRS